MSEVSISMDQYGIRDVTRLPAQRLSAKSMWANQRVEFVTSLFGRDYYWLRDGDGTVYLAKVGDDGLPDLT